MEIGVDVEVRGEDELSIGLEDVIGIMEDLEIDVWEGFKMEEFGSGGYECLDFYGDYVSGGMCVGELVYDLMMMESWGDMDVGFWEFEDDYMGEFEKGDDKNYREGLWDVLEMLVLVFVMKEYVEIVGFYVYVYEEVYE